MVIVMKFNAWGVKGRWIPDYPKLRKRFGLKKFNFIFDGERENFLKNQLIIGHEFFGTWLKAARRGEAALVSGFTPSGIPHLGTLCIFKQMAYYQKKYGAKIYVPIADLEALYVRDTKPAMIETNTINLLAHLAASGVNLKKAIIYMQSGNIQTLLKTFQLANLTNKFDLNAIYSRDISLSYTLSAILMASDILLPLDHGNRSTLVTLGIDEIGHIKLVSKLAKELGIYGFPAVTYTDLIPGLAFSKMSKSQKQNSIKLSENPRTAERRVRKAVMNGNEPLYNSLVRWFSDPENEATERAKPERAGEIVRTLLEKQKLRYAAVMKDATNIANRLLKSRLK